MSVAKSLLTLIFPLSILASLTAVGMFAYTWMDYQSSLLDEKENKRLLMAESRNRLLLPLPSSSLFTIKKLIINLPSRTTRLRFLNLTAHLVPHKEHAMEALERQQAPIKDLIIRVASTIEPDELNSISGRIILENRLKKGINALIGREAIREIYFSNFVIQ